MGDLVVPLGEEQLDAYLRRIGYAGSREPTSETLAALHRAHLLTVPFENIDIALKRPIVLDLDRLTTKIVTDRRGGFCYENNGVFASALVALGFEVAMVSAEVAMSADAFTSPFDHMAVLVTLDEPWLADVGFGDCFLEPLRLLEGIEQSDGRARYRLTRDGDVWLLWTMRGEDWAPMYRFTETAHPLDAFQERCDVLQTSPDSIFVQRLICSRPTEIGRITLSSEALILTEGEHRTETPVTKGEREAVLAEYFDIHLHASH
jgi:N-hydroxyarylamine O-acetyltransferase